MENLEIKRREEGFTLIEVLVALSIASLLIITVLGLLSSSFKIFNRENNMISSQQDLRRTINYISDNILPATSIAVYKSVSNRTVVSSGYALGIDGQFVIYMIPNTNPNILTNPIRLKDTISKVDLPISNNVFNFTVSSTMTIGKKGIHLSIQADKDNKYFINTNITPRN